jgi:2-polyprenyl-3-methyl-5-hydroxy-6-metoxy-1,4-benzoquinol methylase
LHLANRENSLAERRAHIRAINRRFKLPVHPRHLDVGCALGFMLQEARSAGWDPVGVETSEFAARYAAEHTSCVVHAGTLQQARFPSESFDVVTLMDVVEHVPDPTELVDEIYRVLSPGGILFIVTPNFGSFSVSLYGLEAYGVWPDQHVVYFQPRTISALLRKVGFSTVITESKDVYPDNLRRLLRRRRLPADGIKSAFGSRSSLVKVRNLVNRFFARIQVGDKLIALGQKESHS